MHILKRETKTFASGFVISCRKTGTVKIAIPVHNQQKPTHNVLLSSDQPQFVHMPLPLYITPPPPPKKKKKNSLSVIHKEGMALPFLTRI